jgi:glyoxylase-like metal-dependent hydrolase (beta-lactamase superfamily II)
MPSRLHIETFCLGDWMTNCYVLHVRPEKRGGVPPAAAPTPCWAVDAGYQPQPMIHYIQSHGLALQQVVLTHGHLDHIAGLTLLRAAFPDAAIAIHEADAPFLTEPELNLSAMMDEPVTAPAATVLLRHGQTLDLDGSCFEVRHTPGHSPGGIALYQPEAGVVLVGDTLFALGVGRSDFPTSDGGALLDSIRTQLLTLPDDTEVLPGHGPPTTIGTEKRSNPFL